VEFVAQACKLLVDLGKERERTVVVVEEAWDSPSAVVVSYQ